MCLFPPPSHAPRTRGTWRTKGALEGRWLGREGEEGPQGQRDPWEKRTGKGPRRLSLATCMGTLRGFPNGSSHPWRSLSLTNSQLCFFWHLNRFHAPSSPLVMPATCLGPPPFSLPGASSHPVSLVIRRFPQCLVDVSGMGRHVLHVFSGHHIPFGPEQSSFKAKLREKPA